MPANHILIIDDSKVVLTWYKRTVAKLENCTASFFLNPEEALEWCRANEPDLVIVDYVMPQMNGNAFIRHFRALPGKSEIPLVMVTASEDLMVRYAALDLGANDFLAKPVDEFEFLVRARNMLALRRSQKERANHAAWLEAEVQKATETILQQEQETVMRLWKAAECKDPETGAHVQRISHYSGLIARHLGLPASEQDLIIRAAPMHDIGKIGVPDHILLKPGKLTAEEFEIMKQHTVRGYEILANSSSAVLQASAEIALSHHEKFDGTGYPYGLVGSDISLFGRIVAVADVFDALTSERPYKKAWDLDRTVEYMKSNRGSHFDPDCIDAFFAEWAEVLRIKETFSEG
jgi:putative two-component system response regulator